MNFTLHIPDDFARQLAASGGDIERKAFEALVLEEYRADRLTKSELRHLLNLDTRAELDGFLKEHDVFDFYSLDDLERERQALDRLGL